MWRHVIKLLWNEFYNSLIRREKVSITRRFLTVRLLEKNVYLEPCAFLSEDGIPDFWRALGVAADAEEKLQPEWMKGNWIPVAPAFPVLSELIQMQIDNADIEPNDIPELVREIAIGRERCKEVSGITVFDELEKAAKLALARDKGISISPFG
jgi:hypothetical protein